MRARLLVLPPDLFHSTPACRREKKRVILFYKNTSSRETGLVTSNKCVCAKTSLVHNMAYLEKKNKKVICLAGASRSSSALVEICWKKLCVGLEMTGFCHRRAAGAFPGLSTCSQVCVWWKRQTSAILTRQIWSWGDVCRAAKIEGDRGQRHSWQRERHEEQRWRPTGGGSFSSGVTKSRHTKQICC